MKSKQTKAQYTIAFKQEAIRLVKLGQSAGQVVKQRTILSGLGVETAFNSFHLSVSLFSVLAGDFWSDLYGHDLRNTQALFSTKANCNGLVFCNT
jgi:hypothetical protein